MGTVNIPANMNVAGTLTCNLLSIVGGTELPAGNLKHQHRFVYSQEVDTTPTSEKRVLFVAVATGTLLAFGAGVAKVETGANSVAVDLTKNDETTSVLSAAITLDSANSVLTVEAATISTPAFSAGDVFILKVTDSSSDAEGVFAYLDVVEAYD